MAKKQAADLDEYEFKEDDENYEQAYPLKRSFSASAVFAHVKRRKKIIYAVGLVAVLLIGFHMYANLVEHNRQRRVQQQQAKTSTASKPTAQTANKTSTTTTKQAASASIANDHATVNSSVRRAPSQFSLEKMTGMDKLSPSAEQPIAKRLHHVEQSVRAIDHSVSQMNQSLNTLTAVVAEQMQLAQKRQADSHEQLVKDSQQYRVTAVIPNRAWLITPTGETMTVSPGTNIPHLGKVTAIDAVHGRVFTDKDVVIAFSMSE